jgi:hypothetical protein
MAASMQYTAKPTVDKLHLISGGTEFLYSSHSMELPVVNGHLQRLLRGYSL